MIDRQTFGDGFLERLAHVRQAWERAAWAVNAAKSAPTESDRLSLEAIATHYKVIVEAAETELWQYIYDQLHQIRGVP